MVVFPALSTLTLDPVPSLLRILPEPLLFLPLPLPLSLPLLLPLLPVLLPDPDDAFDTPGESTPISPSLLEPVRLLPPDLEPSLEDSPKRRLHSLDRGKSLRVMNRSTMSGFQLGMVYNTRDSDEKGKRKEGRNRSNGLEQSAMSRGKMTSTRWLGFPPFLPSFFLHTCPYGPDTWTPDPTWTCQGRKEKAWPLMANNDVGSLGCEETSVTSPSCSSFKEGSRAHKSLSVRSAMII